MAPVVCVPFCPPLAAAATMGGPPPEGKMEPAEGSLVGDEDAAAPLRGMRRAVSVFLFFWRPRLPAYVMGSALPSVFAQLSPKAFFFTVCFGPMNTVRIVYLPSTECA